MEPSPARSLPSTPPWPVWKWALLTVVTLLGATITLLATGLTVMAASSTCYGIPSSQDMAEAQRTLLVVAAIALIPGALVALVARHHTRFVVSALVCAVPALLAWFNGAANPDAYVGGFCF